MYCAPNDRLRKPRSMRRMKHERRRTRQQHEISRIDPAQSGILEQSPRLARPQQRRQHHFLVKNGNHDAVANVAGVGRRRTITQPNVATPVHEWLRSPRGGDAGGGDQKGGAAKSWAHFDIPPKGGVKAKSIASVLVWRAYCSHIPATACVIASPRQLPRRRRASDECHDCADRRRRPCGFGPALRCLEDVAAVRAHPGSSNGSPPFRRCQQRCELGDHAVREDSRRAASLHRSDRDQSAGFDIPLSARCGLGAGIWLDAGNRGRCPGADRRANQPRDLRRHRAPLSAARRPAKSDGRRIDTCGADNSAGADIRRA